jgi:hypothetical protein
VVPTRSAKPDTPVQVEASRDWLRLRPLENTHDANQTEQCAAAAHVPEETQRDEAPGDRAERPPAGAHPTPEAR